MEQKHEVNPSTVRTIKSIASSSSLLSVVCTILLAYGIVVNAAPESEADSGALFWKSLMAVGLALCFEGAKYGFLYCGFDLRRNQGVFGKSTRILGGTLMTLAIVISLLSVAASKSYLDTTNNSAEENQQAKLEEEARKKLVESYENKSYEKAYRDLDEQISMEKERLASLISQKSQMFEDGYITKSMRLDKTIALSSSRLEGLAQSQHDLLAKRTALKEKIESQVMIHKKISNAAEVYSFSIAILLEIISLLSVAVSGLFSASGVSVPLIPIPDSIKKKVFGNGGGSGGGGLPIVNRVTPKAVTVPAVHDFPDCFPQVESNESNGASNESNEKSNGTSNVTNSWSNVTNSWSNESQESNGGGVKCVTSSMISGTCGIRHESRASNAMDSIIDDGFAEDVQILLEKARLEGRAPTVSAVRKDLRCSQKKAQQICRAARHEVELLAN